MVKSTVWLCTAGCMLSLATVSLGQAPLPQRIAAYPQPPGVRGADGIMCFDGPAKVCATEMKSTTKTVYGSVEKQYCAPRISLLAWIRRLCDGDCADDNCGEIRSKRVLIKKTVPGPTAPNCVVKEIVAGKPIVAESPKGFPLLTPR